MEGETRLAVLESELKRAQSDVGRLEARMTGLEEEQGLLRTHFEVLKTRVALYAAVGASIGGSLLTLVLDALRTYLPVH